MSLVRKARVGGEAGAAGTGDRRRRGAAGDTGMATAELAVALPVLALVVGALLWTIQLAGVHLACGAAAREAARALARGESAAAVTARSGSLPQGARLEVQERPESWQVTVRLTVRGRAGLATLLPPVEIRGEAHAAKEPSTEEALW
jgi:hypothetical protein